MMNCRSVPPGAWEHARQALVFYFSRRHGLSRAEDLAQDTLAAVLSREDFEFEKEEDFLKVCYGFAGHILQTAQRKTAKDAANALDAGLPATVRDARGLKDAEVNVFLKEVLRLGKEQLSTRDWELIRQSLIRDEEKTPANSDPASANKTRVKLHRARKKLAILTGWRRV